MKIHIEPKDDMTVYDLNNIFSLNYDAIETTFTTLSINYGEDEPSNEPPEPLKPSGALRADDGELDFSSSDEDEPESPSGTCEKDPANIESDEVNDQTDDNAKLIRTYRSGEVKAHH